MASDDTKGSRQADHWQRKYYDSLEELEDKEKEWEGLESILRILVARLTLITSTENKQLEKKLDHLRDGMRSDRKLLRLSPEIEEVSSFIAQQDGSKKVQVAADNPAVILKELLDELKIPKSLQRQEKHVRKKLERARGDSDIPDLIKDMAELLGLTIEYTSEAAAKDKGANQEEKKPGLFKSLFGNSEDQKESDKQQPAEPATEKEQPTGNERRGAGDVEQEATLTEKTPSSQPEFEVVDESDEAYGTGTKPGTGSASTEGEASAEKSIN
ncbi:MAG: hypothetical protein OEY89_17215, partial [Gammaproteobacteria bacterium]|nr:hypothetical protein [Gammaproteobacteria bacterium]